MAENDAREVFDIPGVGEIRARPGTSTAELAGAVTYWHRKYEKEVKRPWRDGFLTACVSLGLAAIVAGAVLHFI